MAMPPPTVASPAATPEEPVVVAEPGPPSPRAEPLPSEPVAETPAPASRPAPEPATPRHTPEKRQSVFFPMLLGCSIAGGIGYGIAYMQFGQTATADIASLRDRIEAVQTEVSNIPPPRPVLATRTSPTCSPSVDERFAASTTRSPG